MKRLYVAMLLFCVGAYAAPVLSAELFVRSLPVEVVAPMRGESDNVECHFRKNIRGGLQGLW